MNYNYNKIGNMHLWNTDGVQYLTFPEFERYPGLLHSFSTKHGGVSDGAYTSMNLSFGRGDSDDNVIENYKRIASAVGYDYSRMIASAQDHNVYIRDVTDINIGTGIWKEKDIQSVDGLITDKSDLVLVTYHADCVPIYLYDPHKHVIALLHAGWRGTVAEIARLGIEKMIKCYHCDPANILSAIGPSIGPCCYEVDETVATEVRKIKYINANAVLEQKENNKYMMNLWELNKLILLNSGVSEQNIFIGNVCTKCNHNLFFSHRVSGNNRGGQAAMIELKRNKETNHYE